MLCAGSSEHDGAFGGFPPGQTEMHIRWSLQADAGMTMLVVVPRRERGY